jgi:hypothetical protein
MSKPPTQKYQTTNWKVYTQALRGRGSLTVAEAEAPEDVLDVVDATPSAGVRAAVSPAV